MNWLDIAIIAALLWFTFTGFASGFVRQIIQLGGLVLGVLLAGRYYSQLAQLLTFIDDPNTANIVSFLIIFFAVLFVAQVVASLLHQAVSLLFLGPLDRLLGAVFGLVFGALLVQLVLIAFARFPLLGLGPAIAESRLAPIFVENFPLLLNLLPPEFEIVRRFFR